MDASGFPSLLLRLPRPPQCLGLALAALLLTTGSLAARQGVERLTIDEAVERAQSRSSALEALNHRVEEQEHRSMGVRANYFPQLETQFNYQRFNGAVNLNLPVELGSGLIGMTALTQPVTHLFRIREVHSAALADEDIARAELRRARNAIALGTIQLYSGLFIAEIQRQAAAARVAAADARILTARVAAASGSTLDVATAEARVEALEARQKLVEFESQFEAYQYDLAELVGLPAGTRIEPVEPEPLVREVRSLDEYVALALRESPELLEARALLRKAEHGVAAVRAEYIPDVGISVTHLYQTAFDFFPRSNFGAGVQLSWTLFDFGKRSSMRGERGAQLEQARAKLRLVEGSVRGEVEKAHRQLRHAETRVALAREARDLRAEVSRLRAGQERAGLAVAADARAAGAASLQGAVDLVAAELGYRLAVAELLRVSGQLVH